MGKRKIITRKTNKPLNIFATGAEMDLIKNTSNLGSKESNSAQTSGGSDLSGTISGVANAAGTMFNAFSSNAQLADTSELQNEINQQQGYTVQATSNDDLLNEWSSFSPMDTVSWKDIRGLSAGQAIGNTIGAIGSGASAGAAVGGPMGAIVGGAVGLGSSIAGIFSGNKKAKKQAANLNNQINLANEKNLSSLEYRADSLDSQAGLNALANFSAEGGQIHIAPSKRGTFTAAAKKRGKSVQEFASQVLSNKDNYSTAMVKKANFAKNASKWKHANGGTLDNNYIDYNQDLTFIDNGGTHEENPNEGVQMGVDSQGVPNLVEQGEVVFNDYVFSNRLSPSKELLKQFNLPESYANSSFAYIAEKLNKESSERPNDPISKNGLRDSMNKLRGAQELYKQTMDNTNNNNKFATGGGLNVPYISDDSYSWGLGNWENYIGDLLRRANNLSEVNRLFPATNGYFPSGERMFWITENGKRLPITESEYRRRYPSTNNYWESRKSRLQQDPLEDAERRATISRIIDDQMRNSPEYFPNGERVRDDQKVINRRNNNSTNSRSKDYWGNLQGNLEDILIDRYFPADTSFRFFPEQRITTPIQEENYPPLIDPLPRYGLTDNLGKTERATIQDIGSRRGLLDPQLDYGFSQYPTYEFPVEETSSNTKSNSSSGRTSKENTPKESNTGPQSSTNTGSSRTSITSGSTNTASSKRTVTSSNRRYVPGNASMTQVQLAEAPSVFRGLPENGINTERIRENIEETKNNQKQYKQQQLSDRISDLRYAPAVGAGIGVFTDLLGLTNTPDYSGANLIKEATSNLTPVDYKPIGNYLQYRPFDRNYYATKLANQANATRANMANLSGGNRAAAMTGILAADYNAQGKLGDLYRQSEEYNQAQRERVEQFNRATNQFNSEMDLKAKMANQDQNKLRIQAALAQANLMDQANSRASVGRTANLTNLFDSLGDIGREEFIRNMIESDSSKLYTIDRQGNVSYKNNTNKSTSNRSKSSRKSKING